MTNVVLLLVFALPITVVDILERRIPDVLSLGGLTVLWIAILVSGSEFLSTAILPTCIGAATILFLRVCTGGNVGLGDVKYAALIACGIGIVPWLFALIATAAAGMLFVAFVSWRRLLEPRARVPFAPFLTIGWITSIAVLETVPDVYTAFL